MIDLETAQYAADLHFEAGTALEKILLIGLNDLKAVAPEKAAQLSQGLKDNNFIFTAEVNFSEKGESFLQFFMKTPDDKRIPLFNFCPKDKPDLMLV